MGYIYCITNILNNKRYVGKTTNTIKERFLEHCRDSRKRRCEKRPLYSAMRKYGIENFVIEELEFVEDDKQLSNRETFWIKELNTYGHNGYNASKGGDGTILYDYNEIVELYNMGYNQNQVAEKVGCCQDTVSKVLKTRGVKIRGGSCKKIDQFDLAGNYILSFFGAIRSMEWLLEHGIGTTVAGHRHITDCCNNKVRTAYGYIWRYASLP